ncbi:MAG: TetR/AcrR family transcriptional regulator [Candidatus Nanopelagicales bacterium]
MSPEDRRESIVVAALAVMRRQGIGGTTVRDVATELGTSSGLIHHYFASMDDLIAEAFSREAGQDLADTREMLERGQGPVERLRLFMDAYARTSEDSAMQIWLDAWSEAPRRPAIQRISRYLNDEWHALLASTIRDGVAEGSMASREPNAAAWRILALLDGLLLQAVAHGSSVSFADANIWSRTGAELELGLPTGTLARADVR